ncbi:MAG TPA: hypothetical protein VFU22_05525, partial [Roseiflexaceae bacterium]|nr:hypothetical protein [Roseiflexaceae bacterium]
APVDENTKVRITLSPTPSIGNTIPPSKYPTRSLNNTLGCQAHISKIRLDWDYMLLDKLDQVI